MFSLIWLFIEWFIDFLPSWVKLVTGIIAALHFLGTVLFLASAKEL